MYKGIVAVEDQYHPYTCYNKYGGIINYYINDAIYVTSVVILIIILMVLEITHQTSLTYNTPRLFN